MFEIGQLRQWRQVGHILSGQTHPFDLAIILRGQVNIHWLTRRTVQSHRNRHLRILAIGPGCRGQKTAEHQNRYENRTSHERELSEFRPL